MNDKIVKKLSALFKANDAKIRAMLDGMELMDLANTVKAANDNNAKVLSDMFKKYKSVLTLPPKQEIKDYYASIVNDAGDNEALVQTADHFGIRGEDVETALSEGFKNSFDKPIEESLRTVRNLLAGIDAEAPILKELNMWQREMFYGLIPDIFANISREVSLLTPRQVIEEHAKIRGVALPGEIESNLSIETMADNILKHRVSNWDKTK